MMGEKGTVKMAGAPRGNCNALKHGLYAKHYTAEQKEELRKMEHGDLRHEINAARMIVSDIIKMHAGTDAGGRRWISIS